MGNRKAPTSPPTAAPDWRPEAFERAFTEWDRRYREDPERFRNEAARLRDPEATPETYGQAAAPYFVSILDEI